jgi:hypothetical protein
MKAPMNPWILPGLSLALLVCGGLLFFEVIRPFRDLELDGPIALACWALGIALPATALWLRHPLFGVNVAALVLNAVSLAGIAGLLYIISTTWRLF